MIRAALVLLGAMALTACATTGHHATHPEATPYDASADAAAELAATLERADANDRLALIIFGANWCHDSRALAGLLDSARFQPLMATHYEILFIDVGTPQTGNGRNLDLAEGLGVTDIEGTPTVIVVGRSGATLNAETARSWRNVASRNPDAVYHELERFALGGA